MQIPVGFQALGPQLYLVAHMQGPVGFQRQDQISGQVLGDLEEATLQWRRIIGLVSPGLSQLLAQGLGLFHGLFGGRGFAHALEGGPQGIQQVAQGRGQQIVVVAHQAPDHANASDQRQGLVADYRGCAGSPRPMAAFVVNRAAVITEGKNTLQQGIHLMVPFGVGARRVQFQFQIGQCLVEGGTGMLLEQAADPHRPQQAADQGGAEGAKNDFADPGVGNMEDAQTGGVGRVDNRQHHNEGGGDPRHGKSVDKIGLAHPGGGASVKPDPQGQCANGEGRVGQQPGQNQQPHGAAHQGPADLAEAFFNDQPGLRTHLQEDGGNQCPIGAVQL